MQTNIVHSFNRLDYVFIEKGCPVEMRIYEGLNSWHKIPKVVSKLVD
jgi:hypothetical protein